MRTLTVLVVDDSPAFLAATRAVLSELTSAELVGEAHSGEQGVELACRLRPDLVIMDLRMPGISGLEATRRITSRLDHTRVVMCSVEADGPYQRAARAAGATDLFRKRDLWDGIQRALSCHGADESSQDGTATP